MEKRIYQLLKLSGLVGSSAEAQVLLDQGRVKVNNVIVKSLKYKVNTKFQQVTLNNKPLLPMEQKVYILLNKPMGYSCQHGEKYALDIINADERIKKTLFLVGRLDYDTEGALIITNDGKLAHRLLSPVQKIPKTYQLLVAGVIKNEELEKLRQGVVITIELEERRTKYRTKPAVVTVLGREENATLLEMVLTEGKKRQIRKMCEVVGHKVISLTRTKIGNLDCSSLEPGEYRYLTKEEIDEKVRI